MNLNSEISFNSQPEISIEFGLSGSTPAACGIPTDLEAFDIESDTANLQWDAGNGAVSYNIRYREVEAEEWLTTTSEVNNVEIEDLEPDTSYEFQVQTVCEDDTSEFTESEAFNTDEEDDQLSFTTPVNAIPNKKVHGVDASLALWSGGQYREMDEDYKARFLAMGFGIVNVIDGEACHLYVPDGTGRGYGFPGCVPWDVGLTCELNPGDCRADGIGCATEEEMPVDIYDVFNEICAENDIPVSATVPVYENYARMAATVQKAITAGAEVVTINFGFENQNYQAAGHDVYNNPAHWGNNDATWGSLYFNKFDPLTSQFRDDFAGIPLKSNCVRPPQMNATLRNWLDNVKPLDTDGVGLYMQTRDIRNPPSNGLPFTDYRDNVELMFTSQFTAVMQELIDEFGEVPIGIGMYGVYVNEPFASSFLDWVCYPMYNIAFTTWNANHPEAPIDYAFYFRLRDLHSWGTDVSAREKMLALVGDMMAFQGQIKLIGNLPEHVHGYALGNGNNRRLFLVNLSETDVDIEGRLSSISNLTIEGVKADDFEDLNVTGFSNSGQLPARSVGIASYIVVV